MSVKKTTKARELTAPQYLEEFNAIKPAIRGKGKSIAKDAGVHYQTYINYAGGFGSNLEIWGRLLEAARKYAQDHFDQLKIRLS